MASAEARKNRHKILARFAKIVKIFMYATRVSIDSRGPLLYMAFWTRESLYLTVSENLRVNCWVACKPKIRIEFRRLTAPD